MSKIRLTPNASGTGTVTLTVPSTNTDRTISLPDTAGNVVTTGDSGTVDNTMISDGTIEAAKLSGGQTGTGPAFAVRAFCYIGGTGTVSALGTPGNVSSITDRGTGQYTVNFTTAMPNANFAAVVSTRHHSGVSRGFVMEDTNSRSASNFLMEAYDLPDNNNGNYGLKDVYGIGFIALN